MLCAHYLNYFIWLSLVVVGCRSLESRAHAVELLEDFRSSFEAQWCVCEHGDVSAFRRGVGWNAHVVHCEEAA